MMAGGPLTAILLIISYLALQCQAFSAIEAVVNDPITLPCGIECPGEAKWSIFIPIKADVAHCDRETCWVEDGFQKRFTVSGDRTRGNISLLIRAVAYNDQGSYRCSCDGKTAEVKLRVFVPMVVKVQELEDVTLPCYGDTRKDAKDVQWKKDGRKIVQYNHESGTVTLGQCFEDRFVLSPEAFKDGDLSLHISSARPSDAGLYLCSFHDEFREGDPRAVLLKVEVHVLPTNLQTPTVVDAEVNEAITLPCVCSGDARWTISNPVEDVVVAQCGKGTCRVEDGIQKRIAFSGNITRGNISLRISSVSHHDSGSYKCSCDGKTSEIKLKVLGGQQSRCIISVIIVLAVVVGLVVVCITLIVLGTGSRSQSNASEDTAPSFSSSFL